MTSITGACMCGAVRWEASGPIGRSLLCHCEDCRRASGAPFAALIGFSRDDVRLDGDITHYQSSANSWRGFCPTCGSRLYFRSLRWPDEIHLHASTLDEPVLYRPDRHVCWASRTGWFDDVLDLPIAEGFDVAPRDG